MALTLILLSNDLLDSVKQEIYVNVPELVSEGKNYGVSEIPSGRGNILNDLHFSKYLFIVLVCSLI